MLTAQQKLLTCRIKLAESYQTVLLHLNWQDFSGQDLLFVDYLNISNDEVDTQPRVILFNVIGMHGYNEHFGYLAGDRFLIKISKQLQKFVLRNYSVGGIKAGIYYYTNARESIKSAIDKARKALQYTGDDLTQLYHVFDESVREKYVNRDYVLTHFQEALDKRWIKPYYQMEIRSLTLRL